MIRTLQVILGLASLAGAAQAQVLGLDGKVEVLTPQTGIPSIVATTEHDAYYMQGYLHARDRFFQMDFTRRLITGTLAEMVGESAIASDIQLRTLGMDRAALSTFQQLRPDVKGALRAYSAGVNAWLANNPLPTEYGALELTQARRWTSVDSIAVGKALAFQLSFSTADIDNTVAIGTMQAVGDALGFDGTALFFEDLYRTAPPDARVTVPGFLSSIGGIGAVAESATAKGFPAVEAQQLDVAEQFQGQLQNADLARGILNRDLVDRGSNWWIVSGSLTANGSPILANDPHLALDYAPVFVPNHVAVPGEFNTAGVAVPGTPGIVQGCTETLCWGSTVNPVDATDVYFETLRFNTYGLPTHTVYQGEDEPVVYVFQSYFVNQLGDEIPNNLVRANVPLDGGGITFLVPRRNFGPIVSLDGSMGLSVQFTGAGATNELVSFYDLNRAADVEDARQALTYFDVGSQNFGLADTFGNIAYFAAAEVPIRADLQTLNAPDGVPPIFIRDGSGEFLNEWLEVTNPQPNQALAFEILPQDEMPQVVNPERGFIVNANNDPIGLTVDNNAFNQVRPGGGLYYLSAGYASYRMGRIDRLMTAAAAVGGIEVGQVKAWQANNQMLDAELVVPYIQQALSRAANDGAWPGLQAFLLDPRIESVAQLMGEWDFSTPTGVAEGYDPGDNPFALMAPSQTEIDYSVAATIYSVWRGQFLGNTIDATLQGIDAAIGEPTLVPLLPGSRLSWNAAVNLLQNFNQGQGVGASGISFFNVADAPTREDARDFIILASLVESLNLLASDEFAPAFGNSNDLMDYRWGKLHRIVFDHPLGGPLSVPNGQFGFSTIAGLPGVSRAGGYQVLDASGHSVRADGLNEFMFGGGPARRFVGQLLPSGIVAEQVVPGGQSGDIATGAAYVNQLPVWLVNGHLPLLIDPAQVAAAAVVRESFAPAP